MRELGYIEGKNLLVEWRSAQGSAERLLDLAKELVRINIEVIVTTSTAWTHAAQEATRMIPIVMSSIGDAVAAGFVNNLARPGGNITGLTLGGIPQSKRLELLRDLNPKLSRIAHLFNPDNPANVRGGKTLQDATSKLGLRYFPFDARTARQIEDAFASMARESVEALMVSLDAVILGHRHQIGELAIKHRLPSIGNAQEYAEAGLLMIYGANAPDLYRRAAIYVDKILKGAKPGDLPVEQPTRFDCVVNLKTAKALGIKLPGEIMVRAERFIE
jgi:putative ABC transport system substrate-binding protein